MSTLSIVITAVLGVLAGWLIPHFARTKTRQEKPPQVNPQAMILNALKDLGHDAWWVYDAQGQVTEFNRCAREMLGLSPDQDFPSMQELQVFEPDSKTRTTGFEDLNQEDRWVQVHETRRPIRLSVQRLQLEAGTSALLFVAQDRTAEFTREVTSLSSKEELQSRNDALNMRTEELLMDLHKRNLELESANRDLQSFAHSVAHDLRTPLRGLDGFSQALVEDYNDILDDTARSYLQRIRKASQRMGDLLDDLLDYSRVTRASMQITLIDFTAMTNRLVSSMIKASQPDVEIRIASNMEVYGDLGLVRTLMQHLITNSIKFSAGRAHILIEVGVQQMDQENVFFVRDNGVGFDMRFAGQMFQPFHRLHGHQEFEGNGMGLAVVKRIVERHGGKVWAEGTLDQGATIFFTLPAPEEKA
ncbi:ATP-binding protein [Deinococcus cellulosilyticus]|uniref:histidine kinase n=1 Tax=Deinococcus cellulosilyticus (strain DSM 18568 / NBRC 106333 / KACC 11606 / 5516J-15) TaxID=1223518 RepID=A0A511MXI2_DEIC1|nr:ATP-binding protein [Deinococcus cellulosilyticus]GEM44857.1 hypothetical protein DC3_04920 [Deinococcus cellulosilyticus NBRC 106333 = KACC 11606]